MKKPEGSTPEGVGELIKDLVEGKTVCDVGCGQGAFMKQVAPYAKHVFGIEEDPDFAGELASEGFEVHPTNHWFSPLPKADVYYLWTKDAMGTYLKAKHEGTKGTFIFGITIRPSLSKLIKEIGAETRKLPDNSFEVYITEL